MSRTVVAWLYGDLACPWSYLALGRLRRVQDHQPLLLGWRPLRRGAGGAAEVSLGAAGRTGAADPTEGPGPGLAALGLPFRPPARVPDSSEALRAVEFAADLGRPVRERVLDGLFRAHFSGDVRLDDRESLLGACAALGLDREGLEAALEDGRYDGELAAAEAEADRYGIDVVPVILVGTAKVVGAAPVDLLASVAARVLSED